MSDLNYLKSIISNKFPYISIFSLSLKKIYLKSKYLRLELSRIDKDIIIIRTFFIHLLTQIVLIS